MPPMAGKRTEFSWPDKGNASMTIALEHTAATELSDLLQAPIAGGLATPLGFAGDGLLRPWAMAADFSADLLDAARRPTPPAGDGADEDEDEDDEADDLDEDDEDEEDEEDVDEDEDEDEDDEEEEEDEDFDNPDDDDFDEDDDDEDDFDDDE